MPEPSPSTARLLYPADKATVVEETSTEAIGIEAREQRAEGTDGYVKRTLGVGFWLALGWGVLVIGLALLAPVLTSKGWLPDPDKLDLRRQNLSPSPKHWLGTDSLGRSQLSRLIWGARVSLPVGFASIGLGLAVGATVGLLSGYLKGWVDSVLMSAMDIILAFPALLLALSVLAVAEQRDVPHIALAIGIISVPGLARLVRANTMNFREREFVLAARTLGAGHGRIIRREILPNVVPPVISFAVIGVAVAVAAESALAFVGVSVPTPTATWGGMIVLAYGNNGVSTHPFQVFVPCVVLVLTIMSLYFIGDRLGQYFNVKESAL